MDFEQRLARYAQVLVEVGLRLEPGDRLLVKAGIDAAPLVRLVTEAAYGIGAVNVDVLWSDPVTKRARFVNGPDAAIEELPFDAAAYERAGERGDSFLFIATEDPELLADIDPALVARAEQAFAKATAGFRTSMMSLQSIWCIVAAPSPSWAVRVFPDVGVDEAIDRLWEAVFATCRVDADDPVAAWRAHLADLDARCAHLNGRRFDSLRYEGPGTDLSIGLLPGHLWIAGAGGKRGSVPNLPTEEVFTSPDRMRADGVVRATKPLSHFGTMIDDFTLRFENGAVISATAGTGQAALDRILGMDDGAVRLGEAALVPQSSLVAAQQLVWRNTLYDENDASHLALGRAYPICLEGGTAMSPDEQIAAGLNHSDVHVDFVVGSADLDVYGVTADGAEEPLLRRGEWVFEV
jgi:aminopeptidase